jgi:hypothetical protein
MRLYDRKEGRHLTEEEMKRLESIAPRWRENFTVPPAPAVEKTKAKEKTIERSKTCG